MHKWICPGVSWIHWCGVQRRAITSGRKSRAMSPLTAFKVERLNVNEKMKNTQTRRWSNPTSIGWRNEGNPTQVFEKQYWRWGKTVPWVKGLGIQKMYFKEETVLKNILNFLNININHIYIIYKIHYIYIYIYIYKLYKYKKFEI